MDDDDLFYLTGVDDRLLSGGPHDYAPTGLEQASQPIFRVAMALTRDGPNPSYRFSNSQGRSHYRNGGTDHFGPGNAPGTPTPKTYRIRMSIGQDTPGIWSFDEDRPIAFLDQAVTGFYHVAVINNAKALVLSVTENTSLPVNIEHAFNLYVWELLSSGDRVLRKIDPIVDNPPK